MRTVPGPINDFQTEPEIHHYGLRASDVAWGIPLGFGIPLGMGILSMCILSIGIDMSQHMPPGLGASGRVGASGACCCEACVAPRVNAPEEPLQVPAKKLATPITVKATTAATVRLRSRSLTPSLLKDPIINFLSVEAGLTVKPLVPIFGA
jgi:hypothetical protein